MKETAKQTLNHAARAAAARRWIDLEKVENFLLRDHPGNVGQELGSNIGERLAK